MLERFKSSISEQNLLEKSDRVLLAVSGGLDSVVMTHLFAQCDWPIGMAHVNYQLRGQDSDKDEQFVRDLASILEIPVYVRQVPTKKMVKETGSGIQELAREVRYQWFKELIREHGFQKVATAHHLDDHIETFYMRLLLRSDLPYLEGIPMVNGPVIRPLLGFKKSELLAYAKQQKLTWREDHTNTESKYKRNKIRNKVLPKIAARHPDYRETTLEFMESIHQLNEQLTTRLNRLRPELETREGDLITIDKNKLAELHKTKFLYYRYLNDFGFNQSVADNIYKALGNGVGKTFQTGDRSLSIDRELVFISSEPETETKLEISEVKERVVIEGGRFILERLPHTPEQLDEGNQTVILDAAKLHFPLQIRNWQPADKLVPLGMKGQKKVSDLLIDEKIPLYLKKRQLVLLSGNRIAWVIGVRMGDFFKVTPATREFMRITFKPQT